MATTPAATSAQARPASDPLGLGGLNETALFKLLGTRLSGAAAPSGPTWNAPSGFGAGTLGYALSMLLGGGRTNLGGNGMQANGAPMGSTLRGEPDSLARMTNDPESPTDYFQRIASLSMGNPNAMTPGGTPQVSQGLGNSIVKGTTGKPIVTPKPIKMPPAPRVVDTTTQTATPANPPAATVTTGENNGFQAADTYKAPVSATV